MKDFVEFVQDQYHKGFYNVGGDINHILQGIEYTDFFDESDDKEFPYESAYTLLCGSCEHFAVSLNKIFQYKICMVENIDTGRFHAFGMICKDYEYYFVDARGITTSFDEFMQVGEKFVGKNYILRLVTDADIVKWESCEYNEEAYDFAEKLISTYYQNYIL